MVEEGMKNRSIELSGRGSQCYMAPPCDVLISTIRESAQRLALPECVYLGAEAEA